MIEVGRIQGIGSRERIIDLDGIHLQLLLKLSLFVAVKETIIVSVGIGTCPLFASCIDFSIAFFELAHLYILLSV